MVTTTEIYEATIYMKRIYTSSENLKDYEIDVSHLYLPLGDNYPDVTQEMVIRFLIKLMNDQVTPEGATSWQNDVILNIIEDEDEYDAMIADAFAPAAPALTTPIVPVFSRLELFTDHVYPTAIDAPAADIASNASVINSSSERNNSACKDYEDSHNQIQFSLHDTYSDDDEELEASAIPSVIPAPSTVIAMPSIVPAISPATIAFVEAVPSETIIPTTTLDITKNEAVDFEISDVVVAGLSTLAMSHIL